MSGYIDFEIAREYLHKACEGLGSNGGLMLKIKFDEEPKADVVEVVHGEWVFNQFGEPHCCACGNYPLQNGDESYALSNYCPHCGARMDEKREEN